MKQWLRLKWKTKSDYIISALLVTIGGVAWAFLDGNPIKSADIGVALGTVVAMLVCFGPIVYADVKKIKVRHPKDKFVEPTQLKIGFFWFTGMFVAALFAMIILTLIQLSGFDILMNTESIAGSMLMMFLIVSVIFSPGTVYMLNAKLRYKRIVEYKTAEWIRLQK